jgi:hypothetical protein
LPFSSDKVCLIFFETSPAVTPAAGTQPLPVLSLAFLPLTLLTQVVIECHWRGDTRTSAQKRLGNSKRLGRSQSYSRNSPDSLQINKKNFFFKKLCTYIFHMVKKTLMPISQTSEFYILFSGGDL